PGSAHKKGKKLIINNEGNYIISGQGYWRHPWEPGPGVWLRPMFIKADSMGNEMWVMPFGLNDTIVGAANHSLALENNAFLGSGYNWPASNMIEPMHFVYDNTGNELGFSILKPDSINSLLTQGAFEFSQMTDSGVFSGGTFVRENGQIETILDCMLDFDTNTYILEPLNHKLNLNGRYPYLNALSHDRKLLTIYTHYHSSTNNDISLAKLNLNLEYDTAYTGNYTYDSLCIPGPPQSGFIYLNDCDIITSIEMPSAAEYRAKISHIPIRIFPNPANAQITFALENTEHHRNIELRCFNLLGMQQHHARINSGQQQAAVNVSGWPPGMYVAVVYSNGKPVGRGKFVVRR
ncbi:MAG: T9SS type A sorting domain-containing protein, partial [Bacteroidales bacterium]|nr:T9SS type A sorting domain-containing protein [Bacteroidales bacterium]